MSASVHMLVVNAGSNTMLRTVASKGADVLVEVREVPCGEQIVLLSDKPFLVKLQEGSFKRVLHSSSS